MALTVLAPSGETTDFQSTTLSIDGLGRLVCNTWDEATGSGGPPFTAVVVGSGMYGGYLAAKLVEQDPAAQVLVLEAGPFLISEHYQNLGNVGLSIPSPIDPANDPGRARELVWGVPWRGSVDFPGLAYCCGGKSLFWGGWCPRLTPDDLAQWPTEVAEYLLAHYGDVESETGVVPADDFISGTLLAELQARTTAAAGGVAFLDTGLAGGPVQPAPIAVQSFATGSGLFPFKKFSSLPLLIEGVRRDVRDSNGSDAARRLFVVPRAHVVAIEQSGGTATALRVAVNGQVTRYALAAGAKVVLAASTIESTRLALAAFGDPRMGRNLRAHVRSDFTFRIRRSVFGGLPVAVQTAALLVRGKAAHGRFHLQLTASDSTDGSDALLYQMLPDLNLLDQQLAATDPDWITLTVRGIGEMSGDSESAVPNGSGSWIDLSPFERDEFGAPRAYVELRVSPEDLATWATMDEAALALAQGIAGSPASIEYRYDGGWQSAPFPLSRAFPPWHLGLGTTYHEASTLWMAEAQTESVSDTDGRIKVSTNVFVADQAAFPTVGSVNPVLTGLTLAKRLAGHLAGH